MSSRLSLAQDKFTADCAETLRWLGATEALWLRAPPTTEVRKSLKTPQMEALYEAAFLRIFTGWEVFMEDACIRMMAGASSALYTPQAVPGLTLHQTLQSARVALYQGRRFLLWHDPQRAAERVDRHLVGSPLATELRSRASWLEDVGQVRHRIAHASSDARAQFATAARSLTGSTHEGKPGKLLRSQDPRDALNLKRWIVVITDGLQDASGTICS